MLAYDFYSTRVYPVLYDRADNSRHRLLGLTKELIAERAQYSLAEWTLRKADYANFPDSKQSHKLNNMNTTITANESQKYVHYIHNACKEDIESKWQKPISDEEASDLLFKQELSKAVENITKEFSASINISA